MSKRAAIALACGILWLPGCLQLAWERHLRFEPPPADQIAQLVPGVSNLTTSLESLGAPLYVWALPDSGAALAWGWFENEELGFNISAPVGDTSASFSYDEIDERLRGVVLVFDASWTLQQIRSGLLADLRNVRVKPAFDDKVPFAPEFDFGA